MTEPRRFTSGDVDTALAILQEQAAWLQQTGQPLWTDQDVSRDHILAGIQPDQIQVLWLGDEPAGTVSLHWVDPIFWEHIPPGVSGFVHKLAVRRRFAGKGCADALLDHAGRLCLERGITILRLDTDSTRPKLNELYRRNGFVPVGTKQFRHFVVNLYEKHLQP